MILLNFWKIEVWTWQPLWRTKPSKKITLTSCKGLTKLLKNKSLKPIRPAERVTTTLK
jgi:hypothetical protein